MSWVGCACAVPGPAGPGVGGRGRDRAVPGERELAAEPGAPGTAAGVSPRGHPGPGGPALRPAAGGAVRLPVPEAGGVTLKLKNIVTVSRGCLHRPGRTADRAVCTGRTFRGRRVLGDWLVPGALGRVLEPRACARAGASLPSFPTRDANWRKYIDLQMMSSYTYRERKASVFLSFFPLYLFDTLTFASPYR